MIDIDIRDAFFDELYNLAKKDSNIIFLTADMGALSLNKFKENLPLQYINVGVAEQNLVSIAAGLALGGKKVYIYAIASFVTERCYEQIKIDLVSMQLPVTILGSGPGISYNSDGVTHHAIEDIAIMRTFPGVVILNPSDLVSAKAAIRISYESNGPVYIRIDKGKFPILHDTEDNFYNGMSILKNGCDILIISTGVMVHQALKIAEYLDRHSIDTGVLDVYRLKPVNKNMLIDFLRQAKKVITLEEHSIIGGLGSIVNEILISEIMNSSIKHFAIIDKYCMKYGDREWMRSFYGLDVDSAVREILNWTQLKNTSEKTNLVKPSEELLSKDSVSSVLRLEDFASLFGTIVDDIPEECQRLIAQIDFRYKILASDEQETVLLSVLKKIDSGNLTVAGRGKKAIWEKGWSENLINFMEKGYDIDELIPRYYRPAQPIRINRKYAKSYDPNFEYNFFKVFRLWLYKKFLKDAETVYEFGCGPGHNLVALARLYPEKKIYGLDWVDSAVKLVNKIAEIYKFDITGRLFDMLSPDESLCFEKNSIVITMGALEQLGDEYEHFLSFILKRTPILCVHVEPFCELYDENNLLDYVAIQHHKRRNLLGNYLGRLKALESQGKIKILKIHRMLVGGLSEDGWSYIIWKPQGISD